METIFIQYNRKESKQQFIISIFLVIKQSKLSKTVINCNEFNMSFTIKLIKITALTLELYRVHENKTDELITYDNDKKREYLIWITLKLRHKILLKISKLYLKLDPQKLKR